MTDIVRETDQAKYNRVLAAMAGAGAIYVGSAAANSQMVVTHDRLGANPLKALLEPYLRGQTSLAGVMSLADGRFAVFWHSDVPKGPLSDALGDRADHLYWDSEAGQFIGADAIWPADYVFGQFLLLVSLGEIKLPQVSGQVFCPFCGDHHEPKGPVTHCPRMQDDFAKFSVALDLH